MSTPELVIIVRGEYVSGHPGSRGGPKTPENRPEVNLENFNNKLCLFGLFFPMNVGRRGRRRTAGFRRRGGAVTSPAERSRTSPRRVRVRPPRGPGRPEKLRTPPGLFTADCPGQKFRARNFWGGKKGTRSFRRAEQSSRQAPLDYAKHKFDVRPNRV